MRHALIAAAVAASLCAGPAAAATLSFTTLTGVTGGSPAGTTVSRASVSAAGLGQILSITITDAGVGGAPGQFSGFDLDAIKLSTALCADAACAAGAAGLNVFNFVSGLIFSPGTQSGTPDPKLFGTDGTGTAVNNAVATLGAFDANSTTGSGANGFVSLGFGGTLAFNLTAPTSTTNLYLYIGEVGGNGESLSSSVVVRETPAEIPEPSTYALMLGGLLGLGMLARRRRA